MRVTTELRRWWWQVWLGVVMVLGLTAGVRAEAETPWRETPHFRFFGDAEVQHTLERLAGRAEERFTTLCRQINACERMSGKIDVWVAEDAERFAANFPEGNPMAEWAAGVAFLDVQRIVLRAHGTGLMSLAETFDHEVAHVLAHTWAFREPDGSVRPLPRWFAEGLAIWQADEGLVARLEVALKAASGGKLLKFEELNAAFPNRGGQVEVAYAQAALLVRRMVRDGGPRALTALLADVGQGRSFDEAVMAHWGVSTEELSERVADELEEATNSFVFLSDGNLIWGGTTLLFLGVAWMKLRERRHQMAQLADQDEARIQEEDRLVTEERLRQEAAVAAAREEAERSQGRPGEEWLH